MQPKNDMYRCEACRGSGLKKKRLAFHELKPDENPWCRICEGTGRVTAEQYQNHFEADPKEAGTVVAHGSMG